MADELQALLDRITDEELVKADTEKDKILAQARAEAAEITKQAKAEAAAIVDNAGKEAAMLTQKGEEALRQASRDVLLSLRSELEERVRAATEKMMRESMSGAGLTAIITKLIEGFVKSNGENDDIQVLLSSEDIGVVENAVKNSLTEDLRAHCTLSPSPSVSGGFKLVFQGSGVVYDFSDKSLAETVASYVSPRLASIITAG